MNAMLSPHVLLELAKLDPIQEFLIERRRELLVYSEVMVDVLNPVADNPNRDDVETVLTGRMVAVLLLAFSFAQTGIYADATGQAVFVGALFTTLMTLPWDDIDVEAAFRNRNRGVPNILSRYN